MVYLPVRKYDPDPEKKAIQESVETKTTFIAVRTVLSEREKHGVTTI
jgi:hypothetical protein